MAENRKLHRTERLQVMLDERELNLIDEWRFDKRIPTRAAAIRELIARGLNAQNLDDPEQRARSTDYSVVGEGNSV
ncbi:hypothetical protein [Tepidicaulis sp.]|jgi:hypothetical protein|uniref:hypothetical protein n=1 Tax=Tepidicaulis sp. TaxID=1920809 RepID=UPI003B5A089A